MACPMSTTEPCPRAWIWSRIKPKDTALSRAWQTAHDLSVLGIKEALPSTSSVAQLVSIVRARVLVPARADLRRTDYIQWGLTLKKLPNRPSPQVLGVF